MQTTENQRDLDRKFIQWTIDQYLARKIDADDFLSAIKTVKPAEEQEYATLG